MWKLVDRVREEVEKAAEELKKKEQEDRYREDLEKNQACDNSVDILGP